MVTCEVGRVHGTTNPFIKVENKSKKVYDSPTKTLFLGKKILYLPSCHSTNDIAAELVRGQSFAEGIVVITDEQTAGRGQRGSHWLTTRGANFTFSLVLKPTFLSISEQFLLSQAVAMGVRAYLAFHTPIARVKWPNDLYLGGDKIGGILIENALQGTRIAHSVVGIGLNINQTDFEVPRATSLSLVTGRPLQLTDELPLLLQQLEQYYLRLRAGHYADLRAEYLTYLVGYGRERTFQSPAEGTFRAKVVGVSEEGRLQLQHTTDLTTREYDVKELQWVWEST
jgi:BirA family transcriptional regulator, biotin operon repressor / biotin---[acetyl-CoA-carboxylase] ligase